MQLCQYCFNLKNITDLDEIIKRESEFAFIERRSNYIYVRYKDMTVIDEHGLKVHGEYFKELCNGKIYPMIVDATDIDAKMTYEARLAISNSAAKRLYFSCQAIVVNTTPSRLFANFYLKYHNSDFPIKIFSNLNDAKNWIKHI